MKEENYIEVIEAKKLEKKDKSVHLESSVDSTDVMSDFLEK